MASRPVTLCIINYNGSGRLGETLQAALLHFADFAEILLVDNASSDDSVAVATTRCPQLRVVALDRNRGPAGARNAGFAAASCDRILFQDNDVLLQPECARLLAAALDEHARALLVAPRVLYANDPKIVQYDSADCHVLGLMALRNANRAASGLSTSAAMPTTSLVTACFLIDRARWRHGEPFDEDFGFNLEDHDFGVRANVWGYETRVEPRAHVLHGGGTAALSYRPGYEVAAARIFYLIRNRWWVIWKNYSLRTLILLFPVLLLFELFQVVGLARKGWLRQWWLAVRSLAGQLPQLRRKRAAVQASRKVADRLVLLAGPLPFTDAVATGRVERLAIHCMTRVVNGYWCLVRPLL